MKKRQNIHQSTELPPTPPAKPISELADPSITLSKISYWQWVGLCIALILSLIGLFEFYLPFLAERHYREGFNLNAAGRYNDAIAEYTEAIRWAPWETQYHLQLGRTLEEYAVQMKNPKEQYPLLYRAEQLYHYIIRLDQNNPWYRNRLATVYLYYSTLFPDRKDYYLKLSETETQKAADLDHKNPLFQLSLAYFYHRLDRIDDAQKYYEKAIALDSDMVEALYNLADIYRRKGNTTKQFELYTQIYTISPSYQNVRLFLAADAYFQQKDMTKAQKYLEEAIKDTPYQLDVLKLLITIYQTNKEWDKVIPLYERALLRYPDQTIIWKNYIRVLAQAGKTEDAKAQAKDYLSRMPNDAEIQQLAASIAAIRPTTH